MSKIDKWITSLIISVFGTIPLWIAVVPKIYPNADFVLLELANSLAIIVYTILLIAFVTTLERSKK